MSRGEPQALSTIAALRGERYQAEANRAFSLMLRRAGEWARAERVWLEMLKRGQLGAWPLIEWPSSYEHRAGRLKDALEMTETAIAGRGHGYPARRSPPGSGLNGNWRETEEHHGGNSWAARPTNIH